MGALRQRTAGVTFAPTLGVGRILHAAIIWFDSAAVIVLAPDAVAVMYRNAVPLFARAAIAARTAEGVQIGIDDLGLSARPAQREPSVRSAPEARCQDQNRQYDQIAAERQRLALGALRTDLRRGAHRALIHRRRGVEPLIYDDARGRSRSPARRQRLRIEDRL